ncbi:MAG: cytochrome c [Saprospiraceae bacterium]
MNKHYFLGGEIEGWFNWRAVGGCGKTKVRLHFFSSTLISRRNLGPAALCFALAACNPDKPSDTAVLTQNAPDGEAIYRKNCVTCHGIDGTLGLNGAGDLTKSALSLNARVEQITKGKNLMTAFEGVLAPEEIRAVAAFTETMKK